MSHFLLFKKKKRTEEKSQKTSANLNKSVKKESTAENNKSAHKRLSLSIRQDEKTLSLLLAEMSICLNKRWCAKDARFLAIGSTQLSTLLVQPTFYLAQRRAYTYNQ